MTPPALAAEIRDPDHGLSVAYSERLWSGTQDGKHIDFSCRIDECGGESASCRVTFFATKPGKSQADYVDDFAREFTAAAAAEFTKAGLKPEIVDPPVNFLVGSNMARLSSIRFNEGGAPTRVAFFQLSIPSGVALASCYLDEEKYQSARGASLALVEGITIDKR